MSKSDGVYGRKPEDVPKKRPPARTRARRMQQLADLAEDLLEERVRHGIASPTETVALLRANSPTEIANLERIKAQTDLLRAQKAKAESETVKEELFRDAIAAMSRYRGETS